MPEPAAPDDRGEGPWVGETAAGLLVGPAGGGPGDVHTASARAPDGAAPAPSPDGRAPEAQEARAPRPGPHCGRHAAPTGRGAPRRGAWSASVSCSAGGSCPRHATSCTEPPDHDPAQTDAHSMRMACAAATATTGGGGFQLHTKGHHAGEDPCAARRPSAPPRAIGRGALDMDGDGAGFAGRAGRVAPGHPSVLRARKLKRDDGGHALPSQDACDGLRR
jgi:hypothetical protein